ncbi:MAG: DsbA family oxidoreductase, partial [Sphingomonas sp.]
MTIEFVSDIVCPWCIIGLAGLEQALDAIGDEVAADIRFAPFELNPNMPPEGQNIVEHIAEKYGSTPEQSASNRASITARAAELGFTMAGTADSRIYNTFDAHRLLHWAGEQGKQAALKHRLFTAYFTEQRNPS